jgi:quercetin dioxygenase-like cupin family protein
MNAAPTTPETIDEAAFRAALLARGCNTITVVEWEPNRLSPTHAHAFTARGLILAGGFTLETADGARALAPGDIFELAAGIPHVERVGPLGARILSGRLDPV